MNDGLHPERAHAPDFVALIAEAVAARLARQPSSEDQPKRWPRYLTYETAGKVMDMPAETVRTLVKRGRLPASRDGGITRISMEDVDSYMKRHRI